MAEEDLPYRPPKLNSNVCRLLACKAMSHSCVSVPLSDLVAMESVVYSMGETQSFMMWLLTALLKYMREVSGPSLDLLIHLFI